MPFTRIRFSTVCARSLLFVALFVATDAASAEPPLPFALPAPKPNLVFVNPVVEKGELYQFDQIEHRFTVENRGEHPYRLLTVTPILDVATAVADRQVIAPGERAEILVRQPVGDERGETSFRVKVTTDDPLAPLQRLLLRAFVQSAYDPETATLDFGEVGRPEEASREVEITTREALSLEYRGLVDAPSWVRGEVVGTLNQGFRLRLQLTRDAPLGQIATRFFVATDFARQNRFVVTLRAKVFGDIVARPAHLDFGFIRLGQEASQTVRFAHRLGQPIEIQNIVGDLAGVTTRTTPCDGLPEGANAAACRDLHVTFRPEVTGLSSGRLEIRLEAQRGKVEALPLQYSALSAAPGAEVRDITADLQALAEKNPLPFDPNKPQPRIRVPETPSTKRSVNLKWRASKEEGIYGYLVYRSEQRGGPYLRQGEIVHVPTNAANATEVNDYLWVDRAVEPGTTYFYYLDTISRGATKQRFSGVLARTIAAEPSDPKTSGDENP